MAAAEDINADMATFWNGSAGHTWVARQEHTDITLEPVKDALLAFAAPRAGERVVDIGCGCGAPTLELARAAARGLEEAVVQSTQIGAVNSWLRNQPQEVVSAAVASLRDALAPYVDGASLRLPGSMWLISSTPV